MATREELRQQFVDLGIEPNDDVLDKCKYNLNLYNLAIKTIIRPFTKYFTFFQLSL